jgi:hypothetical protein
MTSKSLKRARHKAALKKLETVSGSGPSERLSTENGEAHRCGRKDWPHIISKAMVAGHWEHALLGLKAMRESGKVSSNM